MSRLLKIEIRGSDMRQFVRELFEDCDIVKELPFKGSEILCTGVVEITDLAYCSNLVQKYSLACDAAELLGTFAIDFLRSDNNGWRLDEVDEVYRIEEKEIVKKVWVRVKA